MTPVWAQRRGEQGDAGGYAATGISSTSRSTSGYQHLKMAPNSPLSVRTRVCKYSTKAISQKEFPYSGGCVRARARGRCLVFSCRFGYRYGEAHGQTPPSSLCSYRTGMPPLALASLVRGVEATTRQSAAGRGPPHEYLCRELSL